MDIRTIVGSINSETARAFVTAARQVIDAMLLEAERVQQVQTPESKDYNQADLSREAPAGGWISDSELRSTSRQLAEAIAREKWADGVLFALRAMTALGGAL